MLGSSTSCGSNSSIEEPARTSGVVQAPLESRLSTTSKPSAEFRAQATIGVRDTGLKTAEGGPSPLAAPASLSTIRPGVSGL